MTPEMKEQIREAVRTWADLLRNHTPAERWVALERIATRCDEDRAAMQRVLERHAIDLIAVLYLARPEEVNTAIAGGLNLTIYEAVPWVRERALEAAAGLQVGTLGSTKEG